MIAIGSRYPLLLLLHLPVEKSNWNRLLLISGERCSSFQASAMSLKYDVPDCYGGDHGGWKQVLTGQNVYGKDILQQKNGLKSSFLARMVVQRFCLAYMESPPPAVFHDKYQIWKYEKHSREICYLFTRLGGQCHICYCFSYFGASQSLA